MTTHPINSPTAPQSGGSLREQGKESVTRSGRSPDASPAAGPPARVDKAPRQPRKAIL